MPKTDYIPGRDNDFLVWHDQFKAGVTAQAATFGLVPADTTAVAGDNTSLHSSISAMNSANNTATPSRRRQDYIQ